MKRFKFVIWVGILCGLLALSPAPFASGQERNAASIKLPVGEWTLSHSLGSQLGLGDSLVQVVSNTGDAEKGLEITVNKIVNRTALNVQAVRFGWYIYRTDLPKTKILVQGKSGLIRLTDFGPGTTATVDYPAVRFAEAIEPLVHDGSLAGAYNVEIDVIQIVYVGGKMWTSKAPVEPL